jgi:hypothetical protein
MDLVSSGRWASDPPPDPPLFPSVLVPMTMRTVAGDNGFGWLTQAARESRLVAQGADVLGAECALADGADFWRYRSRGRRGIFVRHFLQGAPLPVPRLPSRMGTPASPGPLIHTARRPLPLPLGQRRTSRRTVSAPTVAGPTHKKLTPASGAATVDEIHAAASSPPGWTSSDPRAIQDLFGRSRFARGHLRGLGALTPGPRPIWGL